MGTKDWEVRRQDWRQLAAPATVAAYRDGNPSARQRAEKSAVEAYIWFRRIEEGPYTRKSEDAAKAAFEEAFTAFAAFGPLEADDFKGGECSGKGQSKRG